ncbi:MAG: hypothetical protein ACYDHU_12515 [Acidimicrobiales bacterium]
MVVCFVRHDTTDLADPKWAQFGMIEHDIPGSSQCFSLPPIIDSAP